MLPIVPAFIFLVLFFLFVIVLTELVLVTLQPGSNLVDSNDGGAVGRATSMVTKLVTKMPIMAGQLLNTTVAYAMNTMKWWILALVMLVLIFGWVEEHPHLIQAGDSLETSVLMPRNNDTVLPTGNVARMVFGGTVPWTNLAAAISREVRYVFINNIRTCTAYDSSDTWVALKRMVTAPMLTVHNFFNTSGGSDIEIAPITDSAADIISSFKPLLDCQCLDFQFVYPILIDPDYGIIQSRHLHDTPQVAVNSGIELVRQAYMFAIDLPSVFDAEPCDTEDATGIDPDKDAVGANATAIDEAIRQCYVSRAPNVDVLSHQTCMLFTNAMDFVDDSLNAVVTGITVGIGFDPPFQHTPRPFAMIAMPLCAQSDMWYIVVDLVTHVDLVFRLPSTTGPGNYFYELNIQGVIARLHNMTNHIRMIGYDLNSNSAHVTRDDYMTNEPTGLATSTTCIVADTMSMSISIIEIVVGGLRASAMYGLDPDRTIAYFDSDEMRGFTGDLVSTSEHLGGCIEATAGLINEPFAVILDGLMVTASNVADFVLNLVNSMSTVTKFIAFMAYSAKVIFDRITDGIYTMFMGLGGIVRQFGAYGTVICGAVNDNTAPGYSPQSLVPFESMPINVFCAIGDTVELSWRTPFSLLYLVGNTVFHTFYLADNGDPVTSYLDMIDDNGVADILRENGFAATVCYASDASTLIFASMLNIETFLGPSTLTCPASDVPIAAVFWDIARMFVRSVVVKPIIIVGFFLGIVGGIRTISGPSDIYDLIFKPGYHVFIGSNIDIILGVLDKLNCFFDMGPVNTVLQIIRNFFVCTDSCQNGVRLCKDEVSRSAWYDDSIIAIIIQMIFEAIEFAFTIFRKIIDGGLWQTLWDMVAGPLGEIVDKILNLLGCIWRNIMYIVTKIGQCISAVVHLDFGKIRFTSIISDVIRAVDAWISRIETACGNWQFETCTWDISIESYNIDDEPPERNQPPPPPPPVDVFILVPSKGQITGSCCTYNPTLGNGTTQCTGLRYDDKGHLSGTYNTYYDSVYEPLGTSMSAEQCSLLQYSSLIDVNKFVPGKHCAEDDICGVFNASGVPDPESPGACCKPVEDQYNPVCVADNSWDACNKRGILGAVWIEGYNCHQLDEKCDIKESPAIEMTGCCIAEEGKINVFDNLTRAFHTSKTGNECYNLFFNASDPSGSEKIRKYYLPGDRLCELAQQYFRPVLEAITDEEVLDATDFADFHSSSCIPRNYMSMKSTAEDESEGHWHGVGCRFGHSEPADFFGWFKLKYPQLYDSMFAHKLTKDDLLPWMKWVCFDAGSYVNSPPAYGGLQFNDCEECDGAQFSDCGGLHESGLANESDCSGWFAFDYIVNPNFDYTGDFRTQWSYLNFQGEITLLFSPFMNDEVRYTEDFTRRTYEANYPESETLHIHGTQVTIRLRMIYNVDEKFYVWKVSDSPPNTLYLNDMGRQYDPQRTMYNIMPNIYYRDATLFYDAIPSGGVRMPPKPKIHEDAQTASERAYFDSYAWPWFRTSAMRILYFKNVSLAPHGHPTDMSRTNFDSNCDTFFVAQAPPPPPVLNSTTGITPLLMQGFQARALLEFDDTTSPVPLSTSVTVSITGNDYLYQTENNSNSHVPAFSTPITGNATNTTTMVSVSNWYNANSSSPMHPCYKWRVAMNSTHDDVVKMLVGEKLTSCIVSSVKARIVNMLLLMGADEPNNWALHPEYFASDAIAFETHINMTKGLSAAWWHAQQILAKEALLQNGTNTTNITIPDVPRRWVDFAPMVNVTDTLSIKLGNWIARGTNWTITMKRASRSIPWYLAPWNIIYTGWVNIITTTNGTAPDPYSGLTAEWVPLFSNYTYDLYEWAANFNWLSTLESNDLAMLGRTSHWKVVSMSLYVGHKLELGMQAHNMDTTVIQERLQKTQAQLQLRSYAISNTTTTHGRYDFCNPVEPGCINCAILVDTIDVIIELFLDMIQDYQDTKRFNFDVKEIDIRRNNTFLQPADPLTCQSAALVLAEAADPWGVVSSIVDVLHMRAPVGWVVCFLTNSDNTDTHSILYWLKWLVTCESSSGSCSRGRTGIGLYYAVISVGAFFLVLYGVDAVLGITIFPFGFRLIIAFVAVISLAYASSPACLLPAFPVPFPTLPDCLADDIFFIFQDYSAKPCRDYGDGFFDNPVCSVTGRVAPDCKAEPLNFDALGLREMFYVLNMVPGLVDFIGYTDFILLSWIREVPQLARAMAGIEDISGTVRGDMCAKMMAPTLVPLTVVVVMTPLFVISLLGVVVWLSAYTATVLKNTMATVGDIIDTLARQNVDASRYYRTRRRRF